MKALLIISLLTATCLISCSDHQNEGKKEPRVLFGIWIPKEIHWEVYDPGAAEGMKIHKEANLTILFFLPNNQAKIIYSTVSISDDGTLNTQVDIHCNHFVWQVNNSNHISISGLTSKSDSVIVDYKNDSIISVMVNNTEYIKTKMFDSVSMDDIKNCTSRSNP